MRLRSPGRGGRATPPSPAAPAGDSRGPQHGARRGVAQAVAGHGAHVAFTARDEPHAVHGAVQWREAHGRQVRHAQRLPRHGAGHRARLRGWREQGQHPGLGPGGGGAPGPVAKWVQGCMLRGLTGFSSLVALASGVSDGIQKLGSALSSSLPVGPALGPGRASSVGSTGVCMPHPGRPPAPWNPHSPAGVLLLTWARP